MLISHLTEHALSRIEPGLVLEKMEWHSLCCEVTVLDAVQPPIMALGKFQKSLVVDRP